jgi:hypothetical protein
MPCARCHLVQNMASFAPGDEICRTCRSQEIPRPRRGSVRYSIYLHNVAVRLDDVELAGEHL